jgi:hypothetical protein
VDLLGKRGMKLRPRVEPQLAVDVGEVAFHRAVGDEERLSDFAVAETLARELGDASFACRQ